jgi:hypothetical protein
MNASVPGGGSVLKHWLEWLIELLFAGLLTQEELRIIRAVIKAFNQKIPNGGRPKIKGMIGASHIISMREIADRIDHDIYSNALRQAADETEAKLR